MIINVDGLNIEFTRKKIKTLRLYVTSCGELKASLPDKFPIDKAINFIRSKRKWIDKKLQQTEKNPQKKLITLSDGEAFYVFGTPYVLSIKEGKNSLILNENSAVLYVKNTESFDEKKKIICKFYKKILADKINLLLPFWEEKTELFCDEWHIKNMKTRWGTCNVKAKRIWFSLRLAEKNPICLEYVILHELTHLKISNHGNNFVAFVEKYMPNQKEITKLLK